LKSVSTAVSIVAARPLAFVLLYKRVETISLREKRMFKLILPLIALVALSACSAAKFSRIGGEGSLSSKGKVRVSATGEILNCVPGVGQQDSDSASSDSASSDSASSDSASSDSASSDSASSDSASSDSASSDSVSADANGATCVDADLDCVCDLPQAPDPVVDPVPPVDPAPTNPNDQI